MMPNLPKPKINGFIGASKKRKRVWLSKRGRVDRFYFPSLVLRVVVECCCLARSRKGVSFIVMDLRFSKNKSRKTSCIDSPLHPPVVTQKKSLFLDCLIVLVDKEDSGC